MAAHFAANDAWEMGGKSTHALDEDVGEEEEEEKLMQF